MMRLQKKWRVALITSAAVLVGLLLAAGCLALARRSLAESLPEQNAAQRWNGDGAAQISYFFAPGAGESAERVYEIARKVDAALAEASLDAPEGARLWYQAYSTETELYAMTDRGSAMLTVTAFGGDYFLIHTPELLAGSYLTHDGARAGAVFLDADAAWQLFGALNVVGMPLTLGEEEYTVCGVGAVPEGTVYDEAYGERPRAYVLYESPAGKNLTQMSVYEAVLPNPIEGFAAEILAEIFPASESYVTVENSARFDLLPLLRTVPARERMGMRESAVTYPWWENRAQIAVYRAASLLLAEVVLLALAVLLCLVWIGIAWKPASDGIARGARWLREESVERYNRLTRPKKYRE